MFRTFVFTEMPYPYIPCPEVFAANRNIMPNGWFDPDTGHDLYNKYIDIYREADKLGLDIMFNEHHSTMTCLNSTMPLLMAVLARETRHARLLALGNPVANRPDPVRVAEEMALIDVLSHGRLECGFVRGVPTEMTATNATPVDMKERFFEAIDLVTKAWSTHDGPFSWEGEWFQHRQVNIVPRPYQQPHPPIWITTLNPGSAAEIADRGYVVGTIFNGQKAAGDIYDAYRRQQAARGRPAPHPDRFAYCTFVFVGETDQIASEEAKKLQWFLQSQTRSPAQFTDVPGYLDPRARAAQMKAAASGKRALYLGVIERQAFAFGPVEPLVEQGFCFVGSPESVFQQLKRFFHAVGGFGHLLAMMQSSTMSLELTRRSMTLFAREVLPRLREEVYEPELARRGLKRTMGGEKGIAA